MLLLFVFIFVLPTLAHHPVHGDEAEQESILVEKLASIIQEQNMRLAAASNQQKRGGIETPFTYRSDGDKIEGGYPFALSPSDNRYERKTFVVPFDKPRTDIDGNTVMDRIHISSLGNNYAEDERQKMMELNEAEERRRLYAHLKKNPSLIPYSNAQSLYIPKGSYYESTKSINFLAFTYGTVSAILVVSIAASFIFYRKIKKKVKDAENVEYPAYGVTGPCKQPPIVPTGDRNLANAAEMYHYKQQKDQMATLEKRIVHTKIPRKTTESGSEEDDLTVYECPGFATTGEMEVQNPIFTEEDETKTGATSTNKTNEEPKK